MTIRTRQGWTCDSCSGDAADLSPIKAAIPGSPFVYSCKCGMIYSTESLVATARTLRTIDPCQYCGGHEFTTSDYPGEFSCSCGAIYSHQELIDFRIISESPNDAQEKPLSVHKRHRLKVAALPAIGEGKKLPWGIQQGLERAEKLFTHEADWNTPAEAHFSRRVLFYHDKARHVTRGVRSEFHHSLLQIIKILLSSVNVQRRPGPLSFLQVARVSLEDLAEQTGFARSTVIAVLAKLKQAGLLRTKRRKTDDKQAELVANRWLTPAMFQLLGLGSWLTKQSRKGEPQPARTYDPELPGKERSRAAASGKSQTASDAISQMMGTLGRGGGGYTPQGAAG